ncbi:MAG: GNAT family N-acetyltransferase [Acidimicrobiia bacterium]
MADLPQPVGEVSYRNFGGEEDFVGMVAMLKAQALHDGVDRHYSVEAMANSYRHLSNCNLDTDFAIAERAGEIVGYTRVFWWIEEATSDRVLGFIGWTHPEVRDLAVESALVAWSESRLREIAVGRPTDRGQVLQTWAEEPEREKTLVLREAGFEISQTYTLMTRSLDDPIPECPLPAGLEFKPVTEADRRRVWEADQEAFRDHVGFAAGTEQDFQEFANRPNFDPGFWKVAFDGEQIAGQVLGYFDAEENAALGLERGWTEWISTQRAWRGKGVAKAAITESMRMFKQMGMTEVALEVHTTNPTGAYRLYEGLGYRVVQTGHEFRKAFS